MDTWLGHEVSPGPGRATASAGWDMGWTCPPGSREVCVCTLLLVQASGSGPLPALFLGPGPPSPPRPGSHPRPSLMTSSLSPLCRLPKATQRPTVCPPSPMLDGCPPLAAPARAPVPSPLGPRKDLLRQRRPSEGETPGRSHSCPALQAPPAAPPSGAALRVGSFGPLLPGPRAGCVHRIGMNCGDRLPESSVSN